MNSMRISSNNNYNLQNSYDQRFNSYQNPNLMSYENSMNFVNQSYNRDNVVYNDFNNIKDKEKIQEVKDEPVIPERSLPDYINKQFMADAILKLNDIEFYFHKIVLISCSDYINNYFISVKNNNLEGKTIEENPENGGNNENRNQENKNKIIVNFPDIIPTSLGGGNKKICLEKVLKYCYSNQNFKSIESEINQYNIFTMLELAHSLGIKSLKLNLEKAIIKNYLGRENVTKLALESKLFDLKKLNKEAINYIIENFRSLRYFKSDIIDLDFDSFKTIMNSDKINIDNEREISEFILDYIKSRRDLPEEEKEKFEIKEIQINQNENENKEAEKQNNEGNLENIENKKRKKMKRKKMKRKKKRIKRRRKLKKLSQKK